VRKIKTITKNKGKTKATVVPAIPTTAASTITTSTTTKLVDSSGNNPIQVEKLGV
jgi:hypothetical protein